MGGQSSSTQTSNQSSTTRPYAQAEPLLGGILGQLGGLLGNTGITGAENDALSRLTANASTNSTQFAPQINNLVGDLFAGGGANAQSGALSGNLADYQRRLGATADGSMIGQNSGLQPYLDTISNDVQTRINGMFAGAGRDLSGANQQSLARGIAEGTAPVIASQYNTDVANQRGAADALYGAGNATSGLLAGLQQQALQNRGAGASLAPTTFNQFNDAQKSILEAEALRRGIPTQALGLLANIGIPIGGLGSQSTGQSMTERENEMSGADQFGRIASGVGTLATAFFSDRRLKEDIEQVGALFDGTPVYRYRYLGQPAFQIGLMAQDVEKATPEAVGHVSGFKTVNYKLATDKAVEVA